MSHLDGMASSDVRMRHFHSLPHEEKQRALRDLASIGMGVHTIAHATGLSVEMVRRLLADREAA